MDLKKYFIAIALTVAGLMPATAQEGFRTFTPNSYFGLSFNAETNHPIFNGSLRLLWELNSPSDLLGVNLGVGYRGFFDREPPRQFLRNSSFSDYMFYSKENGETKNVRPVGGQVILPLELQLRMLKLSDEFRLFVGCGAEYGIRLYQSHRYANYYGGHMMNANSLSVYPMLGVIGDLDGDASVTIALYMRHYVKQPLNYENLWDPKKFDAKNYFGFQVSLAF